MTTHPISRPSPAEFADFYAPYIAAVPGGDLLTILREQGHDTHALATSLSEAQANHRYAHEKWRTRDVLAHIADAERVFAFRMLWFARRAPTALPGFDENDWVRTTEAAPMPLADLAADLAAVRAATLTLLSSLGEHDLLASGEANGRRITVRALAWIIAGHERHHIGVLRERYLTT